MKKHSREGVITHKFVEMMKLMNVYLNHFPKHEKQALCSQIRNTAYGLFNLITEGYKRYHKKTTLTQIDVMHEQLRMLVYLAYELGYFRFGSGEMLEVGAEELEGHRYMAISKLVDELGKMIGAWIANAKEKCEW
jgi:hypothetical protein